MREEILASSSTPPLQSLTAKLWEGEAPAEPEMVANGNWRLANGETAVNGE